MSYYDEDETFNSGNAPHSLGHGVCVQETKLALLINFDDNDLNDYEGKFEGRWIPKSVIHDDSEVYSSKDDECDGDVVVRLWWALANALA